MSYKEYKSLNLPEIDKEIRSFWESQDIFNKSVAQRATGDPFVFYEGPPSANGMPGIHHVMGRAIKDLFCRYHTMKGRQVARKGGWDTHGLPIELSVEKELGITKEDIGKTISIADYNAACRKTVLRFKDQWDELTRRIGYWVDLDHPYITYENDYIESVWNLLKILYDKNLLYKGYTIQPYSPAAGTGLSSHELNMPGTYKDVKDTSCITAFEAYNYENRMIALKHLDNLSFIELKAEHTDDLNAYRRATKTWAYNHLRKKDFFNHSLREKIVLTRNSIDEILAHSPVVEKILILKEASQLIETAIPLSEEKTSGKDGAVFNYLVNKVTIGSRFYLVKIVLKKTDQLVLYDLRLSEIKKSQQFFATHLSKRDDENLPGLHKDKRLSALVQIPKFIYDLYSRGLHPSFSFLAWTTTPWTLPSNLGLTVGATIEYCLIKTVNPYTHKIIQVVLAEKLVSKYFNAQHEDIDFNTYKNDGKNLPYQILLKCKGSDLEGIQYHQLLPFEANTLSKVQEITHGANPFRVLTGDFVTTTDGTGIVHTAPAFGADDFRMGQKNNLGILILVDREGKFVNGLGEFSNRYVKDYKDEADYKDVNIDICVKLKKENKAFKVEKYEHNYPHCWRTDKPVLYYPLDSWFIRSTAAKDRMVELNKTINWKPESTGTGRFGNWLENLQDWNLSRSRYWGIPLPVWRTEDQQEEICIGSLAQLQLEIERANQVLNLNQTIPQDLHRPFIDEIVLVSGLGKTMRRELDLIDVWFDSGAMPYAQWHYPFENQEKFKANFPADYIAEGVDQTRGWFFTLHAIAVLCFDSVAFRNVVSNGLVLDKNGQKMSKRLGNAVDPFDTLDKHGADAARWYMLSNANPWENLKFDIDSLEESKRKFFGTLYNTYSFFALYANIDGFYHQQPSIELQERPEIDRWILSALHTLIQDVDHSYATYEPTQAARSIEAFVDEKLSNWYVRLCRRRFWKPSLNADGSHSADKIAAYQTLYECLITISKLMAPLAPFFADWLYQQLNNETRFEPHESVHLALLPEPDKNKIDAGLEQRMDFAQRISSMVLSLRKREKLRVRQPLSRILIPVLDEQFIAQVEQVKDLILSEVNVKSLEYITDTSGLIHKKIKANFKTLGKRLGKDMKAAAEIITSLDQAGIRSLEVNNQFNLDIDGNTYPITLEDVEISSEDLPGWFVANDSNLTVALDIALTDELRAEGIAREIVNRVQNIRKSSDLKVTDRINLFIQNHDGIVSAIHSYGDYIKNEVLADEIYYKEFGAEAKIELVEGIEVAIGVERVQ